MASHISVPSSATRERVTRIQLLDESDSDELISPAQKRRRLPPNAPPTTTPDSLPRRRSTRNHRTVASPLPEKLSSAGDEEADPAQSPARRKFGKLQREGQMRTTRSSRLRSSPASSPLSSPPKLSPTPSELGSPETTDDDDIVMATRPATRRKSRAEVDDPFIVDDEKLQEPISASRRRRHTPQKKRSRGDDFIVEDDEVEYISSDEDDANIVQQHSDSRRRPSSSKTSRKRQDRTREEQDELDEDLQDLQDSGQERSTSKARTRGGPVTTQRDRAREHFELLKRRRAGEKIPRIADSDEATDEDVQAVEISYIGHPDYYASEQESQSTEADIEAGSEEMEDEDDFVEDDTAGRLGRPDPDMPLQFTSFASKKPKELFIHIIEWMIKNKIAPAFNREDPVYNLAFDRIDDQMKAQAGSRLISSAWVRDFKYTILARPKMRATALPGTDEDHIRTCDACNRSTNPARYEFVFSGDPYYKKTLEPIDNSDEDEDDDQDITYDEAGHAIASLETRFYLGKNCAANAEMGHKLTHWKYNLNRSLMEYLESQDVLSPESIVAREKLNKKKREKEAETIVDNMEETGVIAEFWQRFENDRGDAMIGMEDYDKKGGRSKGRIGAIQTKSGGWIREWDEDRYRERRAPESDSEDD